MPLNEGGMKKMVELTIAYAGLGIIGYFMAYMVISCIAVTIWKNWAWKEAGYFWEYSLNEGLKMYYPGFWQIIRYQNFLYSALYIIAWPLMVPGQMIINTKALRRVMSREYYW